MKKVTAYQTEDGKTFDNETDAAEHEMRASVRDLVEQFRFAHRSPSEVEVDELTENIVSNWYRLDRIFSRSAKYLPVPAEEDDS